MIIPTGSLVFDIGAHHGESADKFLKAGAGRVVCVEPCFHNFIVLRDRFAGDDRVVPLHMGVWSTPTLKKIHMAYGRDGLTTMDVDKWGEIYPNVLFSSGEVVPCMTLDQLILRFNRPSYCKVDVEGSEYNVLGSMSIHHAPDIISFEFHQATIDDAMDCIDLLASRGYKKGCYRGDEEADLDFAPQDTIAEMIQQLMEHKPNWGNITVSL